MYKKRLIFDSLFIFLSVALFTVIRVIFERTFPSNELIQGSLLPGYSIAYSIFLYFGIIILYLIYGWALRRWFIRKELGENDKSLKHVYLIFMGFFLIVLINYIVVYLVPMDSGDFYAQLATALFEILQLSVIGTTFGVLFYPQIEDSLGLLIFKQTIHADDKKLGLGSFQKQVRHYTVKYWRILMVILGFIIMFSNILLLIVYPSIPVSPGLGLAFFYPNFNYSFNPDTGFRQHYFDYSIIPSSVLINWKLAQSIMSLIVFVFIILIIYLPSREDKDKVETPPDAEEIPPEEKSQEDIAYTLLTSTEDSTESQPTSVITSKPKTFMRNLVSKSFNNQFVGIIGLLCLNFAASVVILFMFQNMGLLDLSQLQTTDLYDGLYIDLTQLYWAGFGEEITFRWMIFGLPLFVIYGLIYMIIKLIRTRKKNEEANLEKKGLTRYFDKIEKTNPFLYLIGGWKRLDFIGVVFLIFSSLAFGYVHYANGWGAWKIFQAGVAGAIFGYAYVKHGLHASILLHAVNNFVVGYVLTPNLGLVVTGEFLFLILTFLGVFFLLYVFMKTLSKFFPQKKQG